MKNVLQPSAESVLIPLGLIAAASVVDVAIHKKNLRLRDSNINNFKQRNDIHYENSLNSLILLSLLKILVYYYQVLAKHFKMKQNSKSMDFLLYY